MDGNEDAVGLVGEVLDQRSFMGRGAGDQCEECCEDDGALNGAQEISPYHGRLGRALWVVKKGFLPVGRIGHGRDARGTGGL